MSKYSIPVHEMCYQTLISLGGENNWIPMFEIVSKVREKWKAENVNTNTIHAQMRMWCVNGHPGHDDFPDHGKGWKKYPTFVSNRSGSYKIFNPERDKQIYDEALAEDEASPNDVTKVVGTKTDHAIKDVPENPSRIEDIISALEICGTKLGFKNKREWEIPLGRIDLVWYYELLVDLPRVGSSKLPVVAFEIETSWRTRKHLKGDIVNFQTIHPSIGVIVQQTGPDDDPLRVEALVRNTRSFLNSLGMSNLFVWKDDDVSQLCNSLGINIH